MQKYNKYGSRKTPCRQLGTKCQKPHDSKMEADRCNQLFMIEQFGKLTYKSQVPYKIIVNGIQIATHILDFQIKNDTGELYVEDVKGKSTADWVLKYKLFHACYPKIPYIVNYGGNFEKRRLPKIKKIKE